MDIFSVLNMDIINSRKLQNRVLIQQKIKDIFNGLNKEYNDILVCPITFTLGDEWQIVLNNPEESYNIYRRIINLLKDLNINCYGGLGIGRISTDKYMDSRDMDGEAFILAREALNSIKESNSFYNENIHSKENKFYFNGTPVPATFHNSDSILEVAVTSEDTFNNDPLSLNILINTIIENNELIEGKVSIKQQKVIDLYDTYKSYSKIIQCYPEYSKASISQKLNTANYFVSKHNKHLIRDLLTKYTFYLKEILYGV